MNRVSYRILRTAPLVFRRWSNRKYAVLSSFHKIIRIGTLVLGCSILQVRPVLGQEDTAQNAYSLALEEVESVGESAGTGLSSPLLRQLEIIGKDQLGQVSSRSFPALLDYYPGVDIRTRGQNGIQSDLSIQGGSFDQSLVLLNGVDVSDPQTGHFSLDVPFSPIAAARVEVLKGPAAGAYSLPGYSGAVNILTEPEDSAAMIAELSYGQFSSYQALANMHIPLGNSRTMIALQSSGSKGYMANTDYGIKSIFLHSVHENGKTRADLMLGWNEKDFGANSFYTPLFPEQYEETGSFLGILKVRSGTKKFLAEGNLVWRRHTDHFMLFRSDPSIYENFHSSDVLGASGGIKITSFAGVSGIRVHYRYNGIYSTVLGEETESGKIIRGSANSFYTRYSERHHLSLSAEQNYRHKRWIFNPGVLFHAGIADLLKPSVYPGINISYRAGSNNQLFVSANRSMRLPTFTDLFYRGPRNLGNPDLRPETAINLEAGTKYMNRKINGELAAFYRVGKETIDWIWKDSIWQTTNLTELNTFGFETSVSYDPGLRIGGIKLFDPLRLAYSYTIITKTSDVFISNYALDNLRHKMIADFRVNLPLNFYLDWKLTWQMRNGSYQYYSSPDAGPVELSYEPVFLADANLGIRLGKLSVFIDATNLTNASYRDIGSVLMPGRWIMGGIRYGRK